MLVTTVILASLDRLRFGGLVGFLLPTRPVASKVGPKKVSSSSSMEDRVPSMEVTIGVLPHIISHPIQDGSSRPATPLRFGIGLERRLTCRFPFFVEVVEVDGAGVAGRAGGR